MVESLLSKWETGVRIQVVSYQRQLKWYLMLPVPCKEFSMNKLEEVPCNNLMAHEAA